jgi:hypothetical protein
MNPYSTLSKIVDEINECPLMCLEFTYKGNRYEVGYERTDKKDPKPFACFFMPLEEAKKIACVDAPKNT